jgi:hypothetical protein
MKKITCNLIQTHNRTHTQYTHTHTHNTHTQYTHTHTINTHTHTYTHIHTQNTNIYTHTHVTIQNAQKIMLFLTHTHIYHTWIMSHKRHQM